MGFFETVIKYASMGVMAWGAGLAVVGIINFSEGHSQQNAARKEEGMGKIIGGGVIFIVGMQLVPQISGLLTTSGVIGMSHVLRITELLTKTVG